ncbi:MAG: L-carnitine dehydratase/bile acid-inducible protein [Actinomycetia bacterium]|nr:L-carnitine dehydratase/bile acid-inducible protein [Actinomycetes bacterium]
MTFAPLKGVLVVALEQAVSAPLGTRTLADLGARVIKVENPEGGDFTRNFDDVVHGMAAHFVWLNRGKESVALDLRSPDGLAALHVLLGRADVLVSNLGPGATGRLGIGPDALAGRHPHLIGVEISGYGKGGPLSGKRAYDLLVQSEAGACAITGRPGEPAKPGPPYADTSTGLYAAIAVLSALAERAVTGKGRQIEISMFDVVAELMGYPLTWTRYTGTDQQPVGMGSPAVAPYGAYPTSDGHVVVLGTTNDKEWQRLARQLLGRADLAADPKYARNDDRVRCRGELDEILAAWTRDRTLAAVQDAADAAGIGNAVYRTPMEVLDHPHLAARDRWRDVATPVGPVRGLLPPMLFDGEALPTGPVPALGEHTEAVLAELGLSSQDK